MKPFFKNELGQSIQFQSRGGYTLFQQHHLPRLDEIASWYSYKWMPDDVDVSLLVGL